MRKKISTRGVARDPAELQTLAAACADAIRKQRPDEHLDASQMRAALVICLRDLHSCTLEQIGEVTDLSAERVRQVYQSAKRADTRRAREARAPVEELSDHARQGLVDVGLDADAPMHDVIVLLPILRLAASPPNKRRVNAHFEAQLIDRATVREIEEWLRRHGIAFR